MDSTIFRKTLEPFPSNNEILLKSDFRKIRNGKIVTLAVTQNKIFILYVELTINNFDQEHGTLKFTPIEFDLRFQLRSENKSQQQKDQKIFILVFEKDDCPSIEFFNQNPAILNWRLLLKEKLNMIDYQFFYQMSRLIGQGSFASCYLAVRKADNEQFAAKAFFKKLLYSQDAKSKVLMINFYENQQSIENEISIMRLLSDHCYIMKLFEVFENKAQIYIILELAEGGSLQKLISINKKGLPISYAMTIFKQLLLGVQYMHNKNIMHRDIKPSNILFRKAPPSKCYILEHDSSASIILSDFGIATRNKVAFEEAGTSGYMGPEVYKENRPIDQGYDEKCDVFSLGCVLFEMIKGHRLFKGNTQQELYNNNKKFLLDYQEVQSIPSVGNLLMSMLDRKSEKRPSVNQIIQMISDKNDHAKRPQSSPRKKKLDNQLQALQQKTSTEKERKRKVSEQFEIMESIQEHMMEESPMISPLIQEPTQQQQSQFQLKPLRLNKHQNIQMQFHKRKQEQFQSKSQEAIPFCNLLLQLMRQKFASGAKQKL